MTLINGDGKNADICEVTPKFSDGGTNLQSHESNSTHAIEQKPGNKSKIVQDGDIDVLSDKIGSAISNDDDDDDKLTSRERHLVDVIEQDAEYEPKHLDDVLSDIKFGIFHFKMLLLAGGAYFAVCSEIIVFIFLSSPVKREWKLEKYIFPLLPVFCGLGGIIGEYTFGTLSDRFGRKKPFIISIIIVAIFGTVSAMAPSFPVLIFFRSMVSLGNGGAVSILFSLLLEFLPRKNRGACMVAITLCGALGAVLAGGFAWWFLPNHMWRHFVGACAVPAILMSLLALLLTEESPRFLYVSGRHKEGLKVLEKIAHQNGTTLKTVEIICSSSPKRGRFLDLFSKSTWQKTVLLGLIWFSQAAGYWGVTIYLPEYMASLGIDPYFNMFTVFVGEVPGLCLAMILIEPHMFGRIRCLQFFSFCTCVSLILFGFVDLDFLKAVFVIVCYFFMVPIYSILNTVTPESFPTDIRGTAMATVNIVIEFHGLITPFVGEYLVESSIRWLYPVVWGGIFLLQSICTFGLRTETAGKDLQDSSQAKGDNFEKSIEVKYVSASANYTANGFIELKTEETVSTKAETLLVDEKSNDTFLERIDLDQHGNSSN